MHFIFLHVIIYQHSHIYFYVLFFFIVFIRFDLECN